MIEQNLILVLVLLPFLGALITATLPVNAHNAAAWISGLVLLAGLGLMTGFHPAIAEGRILRGVVHRESVDEAEGQAAESDYLKSQGIVGGEELRTMPVSIRSRRRLSWLSINILLNF